MTKTIEEINQKIKKGEAVVFTAEEIIGVVKEKGLKQRGRGSGCCDHRDFRSDVFFRGLF